MNGSFGPKCRCWRGEAAAAETGRAVLRGARSLVAAQLDVQVQSVGR